MHKSNVATETLKKAQNDQNIANETLKARSDKKKPLKLLQDIDTRWNSTYQMIARLLEIKSAVIATLKSHQKTDILLDSEEWKAVAQILTTLEPFYQCTVSNQGSRNLDRNTSLVKGFKPSPPLSPW